MHFASSSEIAKRILTGIILLIFTLLILFLGLPYVYFLVGILGYFLLNELLELIEPEKRGLTILFYSCLAPLYMCIFFTNNYFLIYQVEVVSKVSRLSDRLEALKSAMRSAALFAALAPALAWRATASTGAAAHYTEEERSTAQ